MSTCTFPGCDKPVSKKGFKFCLEHWKEQKNEKPESSPATLLSATKIGEHINLSSRKVNLILSELGWLNKGKKGWIATDQGKAHGATQKEHHKTGIPYVHWDSSIIKNKTFLNSVKNFSGEQSEKAYQEKEDNGSPSFREKFQATHRATDGHFVRSRAEMLIDNWLYMSGIVHAYERQLPVEEELYCDFYVPEGKVYLEYWGLENDPKYAERKKIKKDIYEKYNFNLIELTDEHIKNLDDFLPKMLLKFNVIVM